MPRLSPFKNISFWLVVLAGLASQLPNLLSREQLATGPTWLRIGRCRWVISGVPYGPEGQPRRHRRGTPAIDHRTIADALRQADIRYTGCPEAGRAAVSSPRCNESTSGTRRAEGVGRPCSTGRIFGSSIQELVYEGKRDQPDSPFGFA